MSDFAAQLAELRRGYVASLPRKLDEIADALDRRSLADARALAHRLKGTAGSYGVASVGAAASAIEQQIDAAGRTAPPELWAQLHDLLSAARTAIDQLA